jgi:Ca2+-binding RTX toxin-like protein
MGTASLRSGFVFAVLVATLGVAPGASAIGTDPCLQAPPATAIQGTNDDDQLWGTSGADVIYGLDGHDVIKGLGGNDTICAGLGNDGVNGGAGDDVVGGSNGYDLIVGGDGADTIYGGLNQAEIGDGLFGGRGMDTIVGNDDDGQGAGPDYIIGGPDLDTVLPGAAPADQSYEATQPDSEFDGDSECPSPTSAEIGVFGAPGRLDTIAPGPCLTVEGKVDRLGFGGDGDKKFHVSVPGADYKVEFMPRDKPIFPLGGLDDEDRVRIRGLHVTDGHCPPDCEQEIHPVYRFQFVSGGGNATRCVSAACLAGPRYAGSPHKLRPESGILRNVPADGDPGKGRRYCWDELGAPCNDWDPSDPDPFA